MEGKCCAPEDYGNAEVLGDWEALDEPVGGILDNEDGNVDTCC